jgi:hypothetical protein
VLSPITGIIQGLHTLTGTYVSDTQHTILAVNQLAEMIYSSCALNVHMNK